MTAASAQGLEACAYALGTPPASARARTQPEDFRVDEVLGFEPEGDGPHALLCVRKRGLNSHWVAKELARLAGVRPVDVGLCGLKDRNAVTSQWFSVNLAGRAEPVWQGLNGPELEVLSAHRHRRKLRRGAHRANRFHLCLREVRGDRDELRERLAQVAGQGVPNYFGGQRFGREGGNLGRAAAMFAGTLRVRDHHERGMYLSAARAMLFNRVLSERIRRRCWDQALEGDMMMLEGTHSIFRVDAVDEAIASRTASGDIHPTGPLWGQGEPRVSARALELERQVVAGYEVWCAGLAAAGLKQERRSLRLLTGDLRWDLSGPETLDLAFELPAGGYATSVLRELVRLV